MEKRHPTGKAIKKCTEWLVYCIEIGFKKPDLDELENLWWKYYDDNGNLIDVTTHRKTLNYGNQRH